MDQQVCGIPAELWEEYGALQRKANRAKLDSYAWGIDDQLQHFLDSIEQRLPALPEVRAKVLHNLVLNRTKKHSRRCRMLETYSAGTIELNPEREAVERLDLVRTISRVRTFTCSQEWKILFRLANGEDYEAIADTEKMNTSTLKSRVRRWRARLARLVV
jgi:uncharacterized protein YerC